MGCVIEQEIGSLVDKYLYYEYDPMNNPLAHNTAVFEDFPFYLAFKNSLMWFSLYYHSNQEIVCQLQELITLGPKHEPVLLTLSKIVRKNPNLTTGGRLANHAGEDSFSLTMPTHTGLVSPYSLGNSTIKFGYFLLVELKFSPAGGKLSFKVVF